MNSIKDEFPKDNLSKVAAKKLPVYAYKETFMRYLDENQVLVVVGETGSGKTTQIPQWCREYLSNMQESSNRSCVACTQPRRIAAMSVSNRVAEEMGVTLGQEVGYSVRFESLTSNETTLKYLTDGMLLREAMIDNNLDKYNIIILDEAHERTLQTEILFGVIKRALKVRNSSNNNPKEKLKIIIMSATLNVKLFKNYFTNSRIMVIPGRQYRIQNFFACQKQSDILTSTLIAVFQLHRTCEKGDILVFCSGQDEIHALVGITQKAIKFGNINNLQPFPLYASLPTKSQMIIFSRHQEDLRRVIYATNVAETSITVPRVRYVIDTGSVKTKTYCTKTGLESLKATNISKSQATQRSGRAGRVGPGACYRLYTQEEYDAMKDNSVPEIQRCNLDGVLLQLVAIGISNLESFEFLEKPDEDRLQQSLKHLIDLKAIKKINIVTNGNGSIENDHGPSQSKKPHLMTNGYNKSNILYELTPLGKQISSFPLSPSMGKVLVMAAQLGCVDEALTIISLLHVENLFHILPNQRVRAEKMLDKFQSNEGDLIMLLKVYRASKTVLRMNRDNLRIWLAQHFIHSKNFKLAYYIRKQLSLICKSIDIEITSCGRDTALVRKAFTYGFVYNVAQMWNGKYKNKYDQEIEIHPSSCLFKCRPECIMYVELIETNKRYMRNCTVIEHDWIKEALSEGRNQD